MSTTSAAHVLLYPFPGTSHTVPILDLASQLLTRGLKVTVLVTPKNLPLLDPLLFKHPSSLHKLVLSPPSPASASRNELVAQLRAMNELSDAIVQWFQSHPDPPVAIVTDFFLGCTRQLACQLRVPHIVFSPSGASGLSIHYSVWRDLPQNNEPENQDFMISLPSIPNSPIYPWWQMTHHYRNHKEGDPDWEIFRNCIMDDIASWGVVINSFTELERVYINHMKKFLGHNRVWAVGPLMPLPSNDSVESTKWGGTSSMPSDEVLTWLDQQLDSSVVYVCFGSRLALPNQEMNVLAAALETCAVPFVWCVKKQQGEHVASDHGVIPEGFENSVGSRGFVIRGWAPQMPILSHRAVGAFLTHCGWNSTLEGLATGVVMLTWPLRGDQFANAKLLVDELRVGIRVAEETRNVPDSTELARLLAESVGGTRPERVRAMELRDAALRAVNGGSSESALNDFVHQLKEATNSRSLGPATRKESPYS